MINILALLITLIVNGNATNVVNYLLHIEQTDARGTVCVHLINVDAMDDTKTSCFDVEPGDLRYKRDSFKSVPKGTYVLFATLDDKMVSNKPTVIVLGNVSEEKFK
jgi:hypothetical protein